MLFLVALIFKRYFFLFGSINGIFAGIWLFFSNNKFSAAELLNQPNSVRNLLNPFPNDTVSQFKPSQIGDTTISNAAKTFSSEIQQIFPNNNQFVIISVVLMLLVVLHAKEYRFFVFVTMGFIGALLTQAYSGSMGTNFRFLLPIILILIFYVSANFQLQVRKIHKNH
jgi:hypothetical protein